MLNDVQSAVETVFTARFRPSPTIPFAVRTSSIHTSSNLMADKNIVVILNDWSNVICCWNTQKKAPPPPPPLNFFSLSIETHPVDLICIRSLRNPHSLKPERIS